MLQIRLFAGLDVRRSGKPVWGLESRKVKALLAYLLLNRERRDLTRGHLATLLWPEADEETGRQNLRQAVYNLRKTLQNGGHGGTTLIVASRESVSLSRTAEIWLDVEEFESAVRKSLVRGECLDPLRLGEATWLYRGPLLSGLFVDESVELEEWLLARQEQLRDAVLDALRSLVSLHLRRGDLEQGLLYARRWADIDPVSEETHRALMTLYARSGRRARALAQYERCQHVLSLQLGEAPIRETTDLYETILAREIAAAEPIERPLPFGPVLPMVGRGESTARLRSIWARVLAGDGRLTVVTGREGIGKSRLARSFIDEASACSGTGVLLGRCRALRLPRCYAPFVDVIRNTVGQEGPAGEVLRAGLENGDLAILAFDRPGTRQEGLPEPVPESSPERLADAFVLFLERVYSAHAGAEPSGLIVLLEDLGWTDSASVRLLEALLPRLAGKRIWILATCRTDQLADAHPLRELLRCHEGDEKFDRLQLEPLEDRAIEQLARILAREEDAPLLARFLEGRWGGVPLVLAEWVNLLWDEGLLAPAEAGQWSVGPGFEAWARTAPAGLEEVIRRRLRKLPTSARRLLTLGAVIGDDFETEVLEGSADELPIVLEAALGLLVERWFTRHSPRFWFESRRERDIVLWREGARKGTFEFANRALRRVAYESAPLARRRVMHAEVGRAIERLRAGDLHLASEELSHHFLLAEDWAAALPHLRASAEKALRLGAPDVAREYRDAAAEAVSALAASTIDADPTS